MIRKLDNRWSVIGRMFIVSGLLLTGTLYLVSISNSESVPIRRTLVELPAQIGAWNEERSMEIDRDTLNSLGVDDYTNRVYSNPEGTPLGLYIGYYVSQRQGDSIHSPLNCLPGSGWNPIKKNIIALDVQTGSKATSINDAPRLKIIINRIVIEKGQDKQVVLYWYQSHGRTIASEYWGKIYTVIDAMRTNRTDAALLRVISPVRGTEERAERDAERAAVDFVRSLFPLLSQYLPG